MFHDAGMIGDVLPEDGDGLVDLAGAQQLVAVRVDVGFRGDLQRLVAQGRGRGRIALAFEHQGFRTQRLIVAVHRDAAVGPRLGASEVGVVARAPRRRLREALPEEAGQRVQLLLQAVGHDRRRVDDDGDGHADLVPSQRQRDACRGRLLEGVREVFLKLRRLRPGGEADGVFGLVVEEAAPGRRLLAQDHRPVALGRHHVQAVVARGQRPGRRA